MAVAIKILKRVVLSFRCAKNNKTLFRIQFNLFRVSFRHRKTILRTRPSQCYFTTKAFYNFRHCLHSCFNDIFQDVSIWCNGCYF